MIDPITPTPRGRQGHYGSTPSRRYEPDNQREDEQDSNPVVSGIEYIIYGLLILLTHITVSITPSGEKYINKIYTEVKNA